MKDREIKTIELEILSPINIKGSEISNRDYIIENNELKLIDYNKLIVYVIENNLYNEFIHRIKQNNKTKTIFDQMKLDKNQFIKETIKIENFNNDDRIGVIYDFTKDYEEKPYISGTTIKGFLTNAIMYNYIINHKEEFKEEIANIKENLLNRYEMRKQWAFLQRKIFKVKDQNGIITDLRRLIMVSDTNSSEKESLFITKKEDFSVKNDLGNIVRYSTFKEYLKPNTKFTFTISINTKKLEILGITSVEDILQIANNYCERIIEIEEPLLIKANELGIELLRKNETNKNINCMLGTGAGFYAKGILQAFFQNKEELQELVKQKLNQDFYKAKHLELDALGSPRTLKLAKYDKYYIIGMANMKVKKE